MTFVAPKSPYKGELHDAARTGDIQEVRALLSSADMQENVNAGSICRWDDGPDPSDDPRAAVYTDPKQITPLQVVAWYGHVSVAQALLDSGAAVDGTKTPRSGAPPLHLAVKRGHLEMVELLLQRGADANSMFWGTPLHCVVAARYVPSETRLRITNILLDAGSNPNTKDGLRKTPLHLAAESTMGEPLAGEFAKLLLNKGADVNGLDTDRTPLYLAIIQGGHTGFIEVLLAAGADTAHTIEYNGRRTAKGIAEYKKNLNALEAIRRAESRSGEGIG